MGRMDVAEAVLKPGELLAEGLADGRVAMACGGDAETCREVDVDIAVYVEDVGSEGFAPENGEVFGDERDVWGLVLAKLLRELARAGPGRRGNDLR